MNYVKNSQVFLNTLFIIFLIFFFFFSVSRSYAFKFERNLRLGDVGEDVFYLQKALNKEDVKVSDVGPGSPGQESSYFGEKTKNALIRFQEKYRDEVLIPAGLFFGTGFAGQFTLRKLNSLSKEEESLSSQEKETENASPSPTLNTNSPMIFGLSPSVIHPGDEVEVFGKGFEAKDNIVHVGDFRFENLSAAEQSVIPIQLPEGISPGRYEMYVENKKTLANSDPYSFFVTKKDATPVSLDSVTIQKKGHETEMVIRGNGFLKDQNFVHTVFGSLSVSSSLGTLRLTLEDFPEFGILYPLLKNNPESLSDLPIYVENQNGKSNPLQFDLP